MTVTCPTCGYENDTAPRDTRAVCGRCEASLRSPPSSRPAEPPPQVADEKPEPKKGSTRIVVVAVLLLGKMLFIAYHLLGGHGALPQKMAPMPPALMPMPADLGPPAPAPRQLPERVMRAYELFEPEELPAANGMRSFAVRFNKVDPDRIRQVPVLSIAVGPRWIFRPLDPRLFEGAAGPQTIAFTIPAGELPPEAGEITLRLVADARRARPGVESNAVVLKLPAGR